MTSCFVWVSACVWASIPGEPALRLNNRIGRFKSEGQPKGWPSSFPGRIFEVRRMPLGITWMKAARLRRFKPFTSRLREEISAMIVADN